MGQPTPPGDMPLYEGLDSSWNDIVGAFPEDKRGELAPLLKQRVESVSSQYEPLKQWEEFNKSGITPDQVKNGLTLFNMIESDPRGVYETIGKHLGITPQQAQQVVEEIEDGDEDDPRIAALQQQVETLAQITLTERQQAIAAKQAEEDNATLDRELKQLKAKVGDFPEEEILMRMAHKNLSAEKAYEEYSKFAEDIRSRRPAPFVLGSGGTIPNRTIDPTKLNGNDTRSLVAQMMDNAMRERKQ